MEFYILPTQYIHYTCPDDALNKWLLFLKQNEPLSYHNADAVCSVWGRAWISKNNLSECLILKFFIYLLSFADNLQFFAMKVRLS